jgi:hypothetical protein
MNVNIEDIKNNKPLFEFCKKILSYKIALECDKRYLFLASLVSADRLINKERCIESMEKIKFLIDNIELFDLNDNIKKDTLSFLNSGLEIVERDLDGFS